ncbi:MAG: hypothetical protein H6715_00895 [Myxococcales bacterium]|nr:hypothetical protein [Myxococcales bacterium]
MGEQDVLDVLRTYRLSDVEITARCPGRARTASVLRYGIGMYCASPFSVVIAMAGAPGWHQYAGASRAPRRNALLATVSGYDL